MPPGILVLFGQRLKNTHIIKQEKKIHLKLTAHKVFCHKLLQTNTKIYNSPPELRGFQPSLIQIRCGLPFSIVGETCFIVSSWVGLTTHGTWPMLQKPSTITKKIIPVPQFLFLNWFCRLILQSLVCREQRLIDKAS